MNSKYINYICFVFSYLILFYLTIDFYNDLYFFEWSARNSYMYNWVLVSYLYLFNKDFLANNIVIANTIGVFIGNYYGDYLLKMSKSKITDDMEPWTVYSLSSHRGWQIWIGILLLFMLVGIIFEKLNSNREKKMILNKNFNINIIKRLYLFFKD